MTKGIFSAKNFALFGIWSVFLTVLLFVPLGGVEAQTLPTITDPLKLGSGGITELIGRIIKAIMGILGAISLAILFYGGFILLTSSGKSEWIKKGWEVLRYGVIGVALIFGSYTFLNYILSGLSGQAEQTSQANSQIAQQQKSNCLANCIQAAKGGINALDDVRGAAFGYCMRTNCPDSFSQYGQQYGNETEENISAQLAAARAGDTSGKTPEELLKILNFLYCRDECQVCLASYLPPAKDALASQSEAICADKIDFSLGKCSVDLEKSVLNLDSVMSQYCPMVARKIGCINTCQSTLKTACLSQCGSALTELAAEPFSGIAKYKNGIKNGYCDLCCQSFADEECRNVIPPDCSAVLNAGEWKNMLGKYCDAKAGGEMADKGEYFSACKLSCQTRAKQDYGNDCYSNCFQQFQSVLKDAWGRTRYCEADCCKPLTESALAADYKIGDALVKLSSSQYFSDAGSINIANDIISYAANNRGRGELTVGTQKGNASHSKGDKALQADDRLILYSQLIRYCDQYDTVVDGKCQYVFSGSSGWPNAINQWCPVSTDLFKQGCANSCETDMEGNCQAKCVANFSQRADAVAYCKTSCCTADRMQTAKNSCATIIDPANKKCDYGNGWSSFFSSCPAVP